MPNTTLCRGISSVDIEDILKNGVHPYQTKYDEAHISLFENTYPVLLRINDNDKEISLSNPIDTRIKGDLRLEDITGIAFTPDKEGEAPVFLTKEEFLKQLQQRKEVDQILSERGLLKKRFCKSETGNALWSAFCQTNGVELTNEFKEKNEELKNRQTGQYTGIKRKKILLDKEYTYKYPDLLVASIMHETAHAYQNIVLNLPMSEDGRDEEIMIVGEQAYAAVIEADAWARGLVAFVKSEPTDKEIKTLQDTKKDILDQIGFSDIKGKRDLNEREMLCDIFEKIYVSMLPEKFDERKLQPFMDSVLNDKFYKKGFSEGLKKYEQGRLLNVLFRLKEVKNGR